MPKALAGLFRFLLSLLVLAAIGYNTWEITALRGEIDILKQQRAPTVYNDTTALARARKHAEQAKAFLRKRRYADAQREVVAAAQALETASQDAHARGADALARLRGTLRSLAQQAEGLWGEHAPARGGGEGGKESGKKL